MTKIKMMNKKACFGGDGVTDAAEASVTQRLPYFICCFQSFVKNVSQTS